MDEWKDKSPYNVGELAPKVTAAIMKEGLVNRRR